MTAVTITRSIQTLSTGSGTAENELVLDTSGVGTGPFVRTVSLVDGTGTVVSPSGDGTDNTGVTQPAGGSGIRGWLSAIYTKLTGLLEANLYVGGAVASAANPVPIVDAYQAPVTASWTSATALNTALTVTTSGYDTVILTVAPPAGLTGGGVTFEAFDGTNWVTIKAPRTDSHLTDTTFLLSGTPGIRSWQLPVSGYPQVRARLSTIIVGSGTAGLVCIVSSAPDVSLVTVGIDPAQPLPAGTNALGSVTATSSASNPTSTLALPAATAARAAATLAATSATAGSLVVPSFALQTSGSALISRLRLAINDATATGWGGVSVQVDLWLAAPTFTNGDGGAWALATGSQNHVGSFTGTLSAVNGDGVYGELALNAGSEIALKTGTTVYWTLQVVSATGVVGASKTVTLTVELIN